MGYSRDFEYAIGWNRFSLDIVGAWPTKNSGKINRERSTFCVLCIILLIYLPQSASVFVHWGNMNAVIECLSVNGPLFLAFKLRMLIDRMADDWSIRRAQEERLVMLNKARASRFISIGSGVVTNTLFVAYIFYMIYLGMEMKKRTDLDPRLAVGLLHPAWLPFDTRKLEFFFPMWIGQFFCTFICMTIYAVFDCMIAALVLHICGQLEVIGLSLRDLINREAICKPRAFNYRLATIVERHDKLNELVNVIEASFSFILLPQLFVCTLTFCFQGFSLIMSLLNPAMGQVSFLEMAFAITYVFYTVLHLYVYCYIGDQLIIESSSLGYFVYDSQWYNLSGLKARSLLFVGYRASRPLKITAGKFCNFSRDLFLSILKTSMGYLSMLLTVQGRAHHE